MTHAVIVSHGQPSDPAPAAAALAALALRVAAHLPGWTITSATLAEPAALANATTAAQGRAFPLFMAGGWFTRTHLPAKLRDSGAAGWQVLEPFGCDPALHALAVTIVTEALITRGWSASETRLLLAAHGSFKSAVPSDIAHHLAARIAAETGVAAQAAFIDQSPQLAQATGYGRRSLCLPFFAAEGGHVTEDIPAALTAADFAGDLLPALGLDARVPALIAAAIAKGNPVCTAECRWRATPQG
jgi:sirohydrochlorin ferrochelatase